MTSPKRGTGIGEKLLEALASAKKAKVSYSGTLLKPMYFNRPIRGLLPCSPEATAEAKKRAEADNFRQLDGRLESLYRFYGLSVQKAGDAKKLVLYLALAHVPGFSFPKRGKRRHGRPKRTSVKDRELLADVMELMDRDYSKNRDPSIKRACEELTKRKEYTARYGGVKSGTLLRRFHRLKMLIPTDSDRQAFIRTFGLIVQKVVDA